jgi:hypothetical protein
MIAHRRTQLLILLLIASAIAAASSWQVLNSHRQYADASQKDRAICLTELAAIGGKATAAEQSTVPDDLAINRRLRGAAIAAHLSDQLASIEPGAAARLPNSDLSQTPIYLRLNAVSLKQLVGFLCELSATDNTLRTSDIELSPPLAAPSSRAEPAEVWTADITLSYLTVEPPTNNSGQPVPADNGQR